MFLIQAMMTTAVMTAINPRDSRNYGCPMVKIVFWHSLHVFGQGNSWLHHPKRLKKGREIFYLNILTVLTLFWGVELSYYLRPDLVHVWTFWFKRELSTAFGRWVFWIEATDKHTIYIYISKLTRRWRRGRTHPFFWRLLCQLNSKRNLFWDDLLWNEPFVWRYNLIPSIQTFEL